MNKDQALSQLFERIGSQTRPSIIDYNEVECWQEGALDALLGSRLIGKHTSAVSITCIGCEEQCAMSVTYWDERAFIACDHMDHQNHMGRINIPLERVQQWSSSAEQVAKVLMRFLGLSGSPEFQTNTANYKLGFLKSKKGRRLAYLQCQPLALVINHNAMPIDGLIYFDGNTLKIDQDNISTLLNASHKSQNQECARNIDKRERSKQDTQEQYANWQDEYKRLQKAHPTKNKTWISQKIAKSAFGNSASPETIRKNIKV